MYWDYMKNFTKLFRRLFTSYAHIETNINIEVIHYMHANRMLAVN